MRNALDRFREGPGCGPEDPIRRGERPSREPEENPEWEQKINPAVCNQSEKSMHDLELSLSHSFDRIDQLKSQVISMDLRIRRLEGMLRTAGLFIED